MMGQDSINFTCPDCGRRLRVPAANAGRRGVCPGCGAAVQVPAAPAFPAPEETGPPAASPAGGEEEQPGAAGGGLDGEAGFGGEEDGGLAAPEEGRSRRLPALALLLMGAAILALFLLLLLARADLAEGQKQLDGLKGQRLKLEQQSAALAEEGQRLAGELAAREGELAAQRGAGEKLGRDLAEARARNESLAREKAGLEGLLRGDAAQQAAIVEERDRLQAELEAARGESEQRARELDRARAEGQRRGRDQQQTIGEQTALLGQMADKLQALREEEARLRAALARATATPRPVSGSAVASASATAAATATPSPTPAANIALQFDLGPLLGELAQETGVRINRETAGCFDLAGDVSPGILRQYGRSLEEAYAAFRRTFPPAPGRENQRYGLLVFTGPEPYHAFALKLNARYHLWDEREMEFVRQTSGMPVFWENFPLAIRCGMGRSVPDDCGQLVHTAAHLLMMPLDSRGSLPTWVKEGYAYDLEIQQFNRAVAYCVQISRDYAGQYQESEADFESGERWGDLLRDLARRNKSLPFDSLRPLTALTFTHVARATAWSYVRLMVAADPAKFKRFVELIARDRRNQFEAFREVYGVDSATFENWWRGRLAALPRN